MDADDGSSGRSGATATGLLPAGVVAALLCTLDASADEVCRFAGTTDYAGHVGATTNVAATDGITTVDVAVKFEATTMLLPVRYLVEEVSTWRAGELESMAVNTRYLVGGYIVRQQRDDFSAARTACRGAGCRRRP